jgi:tetratricopeptide (TPR) repeat protein
MRKAWLSAVSVAVSSVGMAGALAIASPADMAMAHRQPAQPAAAKPLTSWLPGSSAASSPARPEAALPSSQISPMHHPVQYLKASIAEMPIHRKADAPSRTLMQPARPKFDSISLNTPVGPPTPELYIYTAQLSEKQGDIGQARQQFERAFALWPGHVEVLRAAARMEDRLGNLPAAENLYQRAAASNPQHAGALNDLGLCLARQGKLDASLQVIEQAVHLQPEKALYRNNAATVLVEMHQDQKALAHLAAVHSVADANYNLGQLLVQRNRAADAAPYFQAALQQNPTMQSAQEALARLQGVPVGPSAPTAYAPAVQPQPAAPAGPVMAPQQGWSSGPELNYPATARTPNVGTSSSVSPHYLPPVAAQPGAMSR